MTPKVLLLDIETSPIISYVWGLFDQNVPLNQIKQDWHLLSWAAKWLGEKKIMYEDQRKAKNIEDDSKIAKSIWKLLDEADIVITQNGKSFDIKKLNSRFIAHGFRPPAPFKQIDTLVLAKRYFGFTSNKLAYMTDKLCTKYKKLDHHKFSGFELWKECLAGNLKAWKEMEKYNKYDVLSLEELYNKLMPWDSNKTSFASYEDKVTNKCNCGSTAYQLRGYQLTKTGKYQRYQCLDCGSWFRGKINYNPRDIDKQLLRNIT